MKIKVAGSMTFAKDMIQIRDELVQHGHEVIVPTDADEYANAAQGGSVTPNQPELNIIQEYYTQIQAADAVLVLNKDKYEIKNYVGGNSLIEMAFAYIMGKKVFLLNAIPAMSYTHEIQSMQPVIVNGDLNLIR